METLPKRKVYTIRYNGDPRFVEDNHKSDILHCIDDDVKCFTNECEAIYFLSECTSPITTIEELVPELKKRIKYDYILPESHIRPKHQLMPMSDMEEIFTNSDGNWSKPY